MHSKQKKYEIFCWFVTAMSNAYVLPSNASQCTNTTGVEYTDSLLGVMLRGVTVLRSSAVTIGTSDLCKCTAFSSHAWFASKLGLDRLCINFPSLVLVSSCGYALVASRLPCFV